MLTRRTRSARRNFPLPMARFSAHLFARALRAVFFRSATSAKREALPRASSFLRLCASACGLLLLAGCSSVEPKAVDVRVQCIPLTQWTASQQDEMRKEYDALPKDAILRGVFMDWVAMRDATRACKGDHHGGS
jgi:hypothetical protein